jgi:predicted amidophosphoribosyltransferase
VSGPLLAPLRALLDVIYPERCELCGAGRHQRPWSAAGSCHGALRPWDVPHLCAACASGLVLAPAQARLTDEAGASALVFAARREDRDLVQLVGAFKYHGLRGLAWPLARLLAAPLAAGCADGGEIDALVPLPLHRHRRRERGFNQVEILAHLAAAAAGIAVRPEVLARRRLTAQQASCEADAVRRRRNVAGAFVARPPAPGDGVRIALVDDLVTTGATWFAAARALRAAGWDVRWGLALGVAARLTGAVVLDSPEPAA